MQYVLNIALAAVMALSGLPHVFCACGCAGGEDAPAAKKRSAPACPHCRPANQGDSAQKAPRPCECPRSDRVQATSQTVTVQVSQPETGPWSAAAQEAAILFADSDWRPDRSGALGPPGSLAATATSIPILLGRLLL